MKAVITLTVAEISEALLDYLDNKSETVEVADHAAVKIEFNTDLAFAGVSGATITIEERLVEGDGA